jgi:hypothetical protein
MELSKRQRDEMNQLSKDVFGASSRWQKLVGKGYQKLITEKKKEMVPAEKEGEAPTEQEIDVAVKRADGALQYTNERYTTESIREYMVERKKQLDFIRAEIKRQQDELKAKEAQSKATDQALREASGTAI